MTRAVVALPRDGGRTVSRARDGRFLLIMAILVEVVAVWFVHWIHTRGYIDTEVYQLGARAYLRGYDLYGDLDPANPGTTLPFIYPPFAALLFVPLYWLPTNGAVVAIAVLSHLGVLVTAYSFARSSHYFAPRPEFVAAATVGLMPVLTLIEPGRETLNYGQINIVLMALVAADCLLPKTFWPRGMLVGLAAAIKLTPLGFLLLFAIRRDLRSAVVTLSTFAATVVIGFVAMPKDAAEWWLHKMWETGDSFGPNYAGNLTLRSLLAKQSLTGTTLNSLWLAGSAVLVVLAVLGVLYALRRRNHALAVVINAVLIVVISPISWSHHWVWAGPALALTLMMALRHRWLGVVYAVALCALTFLIGPQWYLPYTDDMELTWTFSQQVIGNAYTLIGMGFLGCCAVAWYRFRPPRSVARSTPGPEGQLIGTR